MVSGVYIRAQNAARFQRWDIEACSETKLKDREIKTTQAEACATGAAKRDLTARVSRCYRWCVLVEVRKQGVAGRMFRGASEACAKGAAGDSAEVAVGSPAEVAGGRG